MGRHPILAAVGWLAATVAATLVGLGAIQLIGAGITGTPGGVRDQREVERALASPAAATSTPAVSPAPTRTAASPSPTATGAARRGFGGPGGSAVAECVPAGVHLVSWVPAQGYRVKEVERGPDDHVKVRFVGPGGEHELRLRCVDGVPVSEVDD